VIIGVAYFYVWQARTNVATQVQALSANLTVAQLQINAIKAPADSLESKLEAINTELAAAQAGFPNTLERNEVIDYLLDVADDYNISILPLNSNGWSEQNIGLQYRVLKMTAIARGSLKDVEDFMIGLQAGRYTTLVITGCNVERTNTGSSDFPRDEMPVKVNIEISVYTVVSQPGEGALK
jgi:hypothetical protein